MADSGKNSTPTDDKAVDDSLGLRSPLIYEVIRREGVEELKRPTQSLFLSGIAAGLAISFSIYCKAFLYVALEGHSLQSLLSNIGYTVGFIIVIFGRLQLFTESTITVVLPLLRDTTKRCLAATLRLWAIVFIANMLGSLFSILFVYHGGLFPPEQVAAILSISHHLTEYSPLAALLYGIPAGFLIASIVWIQPSAEGSRFWIILLITYMIALGGMTHVVAGSTEWFALALAGEMSWSRAVFGGILPALTGNIIGGTGLFAMLSYGQTQKEM